MDDFVIIHESKEYLRYCLKVIDDKLFKEYKLELNKKTKIYHICEGIEFLGFRFIIRNKKLIMRIRNNTKKRFKRRINIIKKLKKYKYISKRKYELLVGSYKAFLNIGNCYNLCRSIKI